MLGNLSMTTVSLYLKENVLYPKPQILNFEKIAAFIGKNGSGKSTILKSIFDEKLSGNEYKGYKIVCFSSGQNESFSNGFSNYLNTERLRKNALSLDCFYYDKDWSKLLIFLATTSKPLGYVRTFLKGNGYVTINEFDEDETTKLSVEVKVDRGYINLVKEARRDETNGKPDVVITRAYHLTLANFVRSVLDKEFDFETPLDQTGIVLSQTVLSHVSFERDYESYFDSRIMFFTQAADNDYFFVKGTFDLKFGNSGNEISLDDLSDGEFQLLFLYSLFDLFDSPTTLFLLDEADSHLHYRNIETLWNVFERAEGRIITTTHLVDSIAKAGVERLRVVSDGRLDLGQDLVNLSANIRDLSEIHKYTFDVYSLFPNIVLMDSEADWIQFKLLAVKKLGNTIEEREDIEKKLSEFHVIACPSGCEMNNGDGFAEAKINWLRTFRDCMRRRHYATKNVFLICDRDELAHRFIGTKECSLLVNKKDLQAKMKLEKDVSGEIRCHLLSWKRREIKHYLLSYSALKEEEKRVEHDLDLGPKSKLNANSSGDLTIDGLYNKRLAEVPSQIVKDILDSSLNIDGYGFSEHKAQKFVDKVPQEEISDDIVAMFNYLIETK